MHYSQVQGPGPGRYDAPKKGAATVSSIFQSKVPRFKSSATVSMKAICRWHPIDSLTPCTCRLVAPHPDHYIQMNLSTFMHSVLVCHCILHMQATPGPGAYNVAGSRPYSSASIMHLSKKHGLMFESKT